MPSRRRPAPISAAALPVSRLPLGTPQLVTSRSSASARSASRSPPTLESQFTGSSSDQAPTSLNQPETTAAGNEDTMAPKDSSNTAPSKSIAEAKLERQRQRIQEAEAALTPPAPLPLDRRAQQSRGRGKQWRPFNYTADTIQSNTPSEGGVPVSEVRVNTFRPSSRASTLSRPMSVLSQRTSETGPSDMERQDSLLTENGFQLYKSRRNRKNVEELSAYADKPEERQTTVEASFDEREIYEIFGNALPGQEFIEENVGFRNGQLQFIQHPNGDVSAHQWSAERYIWENIGQFSNIRKKVEGQLAADRLKGETAYQTLQQNTLAYFRTIAKQREANIMGLPFGPKEIRAAIPETRIEELTVAPTGLKETTQVPAAAEQPQSRTDTHEPEIEVQGYHRTAEEQSTAPPPQSYFAQNVPQGPRADRFDFGTYYGQQVVRQEDPFYSRGSYQRIYGGYPYDHSYYQQPPKPPSSNLYMPSTTNRSHGLQYDFHLSPPNATSRRSQDAGAQASYHNASTLANRAERPVQQTYSNQMMGTTRQGYPQYHATGLGNQSALGEASSTRDSTSTVVDAARPRPVTPHETRMAIRDQLWKHVETAKERSLSQANIRTVLYDPFQSQSPTTQEQPEKTLAKQSQVSTTFSKHVVGNTLQPPSSFDPSSSKFFPTVLAPQVRGRTSPSGSTVTNNLKDSSPDPYPTKSYNQATPLLITSSASKPTPQTFKGPFFADEPSLHTSVGSVTSSGVSRRSYDEELNDWWTSSSKFALQEDLFQSIASARKDSFSGIGSPLAHLTPIGPPSRTPRKQGPSFNTTTTRLLIPMWENLSSYVQGPAEKRRDYFSQWSKPPEWCIDRSEHGNDSFYDNDWGRPPARVGRDPRYSGRGWPSDHTPQRGRFSGSPGTFGSGATVAGGLDRRFAFGGMY